MSDRASDGAVGVAFLCARDGRIEHVFRDDLGVLAAPEAVADWSTILDPSSAAKARRFLADAVVSGVALDWELGVSAGNGVRLLHFAAASTDRTQVLVVGASSASAVLQYYEELMRINNEQANALRSALKGRALEATNDRDGETYDRMMRLNNELATLQRELTKKNVELERANRLKNQFLGMAAHDLRNPLGAIRSFSTMLLDETMAVPPATARDFLARIRASSEFMLRLIDDLLDIAAIESGQLRLDARPLDLPRLVGRVVEILRLVADEKKIAIEVAVAPDVSEIVADATKLEQVAMNLIGNAVKFSHGGSTIRVGLRRDGDGVALTVADEGIGIPAAEIAQIFRPFARGTPTATAGERSTGLGLAIAKRVVDGHGGRLWCESEVGRGTTFHAWLPEAPTTAAA